METFITKAGELVLAGFCISIGFWAGRKLTDRADELIYTHSAEYKESVAKLAEEMKAKQETPVVGV